MVSIESLTSEDLKPFPKLVSLGFGYNRFLVLESDLFRHTEIHKFWKKSAWEHRAKYTFRINICTFWEKSLYCVDASAGTPQEVQGLNDLLLIACPLLEDRSMTSTVSTASSTTDWVKCTARCSINNETDQLQTQVREQQSEITGLKNLIAELGRRTTRVETKVNQVQISPWDEKVKRKLSHNF